MAPYDYTDAPPREFELIPHGTIATVSTHIKGGNAGEDGMLTRSKAGDAEMLNLELTVLDGQFKGRKIWEHLILDGSTQGHAEAINISRRTLKAIIESARNIKPDDISAEARALRTVNLKDFEGMCFTVKIGVEKGGPKKDKPGENWDDKNIIAAVITPDKKEWKPAEQPPPFNGGGGAVPTASNTTPVERPKWANE